MSSFIPVILSGGGGTRLWPLSTEVMPKQFHSLDSQRTLLQRTVGRLEGLPFDPPVVVCGARHAERTVQQLAQVGHPPGRMILEPVGRNTAPAIAAAVLASEPESILLVLPADHSVSNEHAFRQAVGLAVEEAVRGEMVVFGVKPYRPDTGMGYIEPSATEGAVAALVRFVEKPDAAGAVDLMRRGYLWNSGMFVFRADRMLDQFERHAPGILEVVRTAMPASQGSEVVLGETFGQAPALSIDHAVYEHLEEGRVVILDCGWDDVGTWAALLDDDSGATVTVGEVFAVDSAGSYVRSGGRPIALIGVDDVIVVETDEGVLVVDRSRAQDVRLAADWFAASHQDP